MIKFIKFIGNHLNIVNVDNSQQRSVNDINPNKYPKYLWKCDLNLKYHKFFKHIVILPIFVTGLICKLISLRILTMFSNLYAFSEILSNYISILWRSNNFRLIYLFKFASMINAAFPAFIDNIFKFFRTFKLVAEQHDLVWLCVVSFCFRRCFRSFDSICVFVCLFCSACSPREPSSLTSSLEPVPKLLGLTN